MTTARVLDKNEVSINGVRYRSKGPVTQSLASIYPQKYVIGDTTKDSQERASIWAPTFTAGIGKNKVKPGEPSDRAWWATCQLRYNHQVVLPELATTTAASGATGSFQIGAIGELASEIYAAFGTDVRKYNHVTDSWGSSLATLPANATDAINFRLGGTVYLAFATTGGYTYTSDGVTWTDDTRDALYLAYWDNRLWGIDNTGLLWYSYNIGVEQDDAQLQLPNGSVTDLFVARNSSGALSLFIATTRGLYAHANDLTQFLFTELELPQSPDNGTGCTRWRDSTYIPAGLAVYRYIQGNNSAIVTVMGPDRDDGLPSAQRGVIQQLVGTHNELLAILDATSAPAKLNTYITSGLASHRGTVINPNTGFSSILGWNELGWAAKWVGSSTGAAITYGYVSNAYSQYRLWWAQGQRILFMPLQRDIQNPEEISTLTYATSGELITPWLEPDRDVDSTGIYLRVDVTNATSTQTVVVDYAINYATTWTNLGTISTNGVTQYLLPNSTAPAGVVFRNFRLRFTLARGTTTTTTPIMRSVTFQFRKKLPAKYAFQVELDLYNGNGDLTPKQQRDALRTAIEQTTFVVLGYRNDTGTDFGATDRRFYVDVMSATNLEETGEDERGTSLVTMVEA